VDERQAQASVLIRAPRVGDGDDLAHCWMDAATHYASLAPDLFRVPEAEGLAQWLEAESLNGDGEDSLMRVAEHDGHAVGFVTAAIERPAEDAARQFVRDVGRVRLVVQALVVQAAYRRRGIGAQLMLAAEEWGRGRGADIALLDAYVRSDLSVPFYEGRMGYSRRALRFRKTLA
jgi:GNAT superfamily N-acetyltransferase